MRALVFPAIGAAEMAERAAPTPGPGEVLVQVSAAGLCAGDLSIYTGKNPYVSYPRIGCHEIAGKVVAHGAGVTSPAIGTRVVVEPFIGCGKCYPCRVGKPKCCVNLSIIGIHRDGGFADFVTAPATHLHAIPDGMTDVHAAFAEPVAIGVQGCNRGQVMAADHVLVLGAGPVGLAVAEVARERGAQVLVTDLNAARLQIAADLGLATLPAGPDLEARVRAMTGGDGMPVVMEATGAVPAIEQAAQLVAPGGRVVILGLVGRGGAKFPPQGDAFEKGARAVHSWQAKGKGRVHVEMGVDERGGDEAARGVDGFLGLRRDAGFDGDDERALDGDVLIAAAIGQVGVFDDQVEHGGPLGIGGESGGGSKGRQGGIARVQRSVSR